MNHTRKNIRLGIFLNIGIGIVFIVAAVIVVITVNYSMRQQALAEAQLKARVILDRNLATHAYFSQIMKPSILAWSEPFRTKEYFDHTWMSSTYAIREIEKYFKSFNPAGYSFRDAAINARSPENEADKYERAFIEKLNIDKKLESESTVRNIDGKPYLVVLKKGEVMEASCLQCHSHPKNAPKGLTDYYGSERSFNRKAGDTISAVSLRIPLAEAYAAANAFSLKLSAILLIVLASLFIIQYRLYRRYLLEPLNIVRDKAHQIATHEEHLGEQIPQPFGRELSELTATFNEMSVRLRHERDHLEELVDQRTEALQESENRYRELFEQMSSAVAVYEAVDDGEDFIFRDFNSAGEAIEKVNREDIIGKRVTEVFPGVKEFGVFEVFQRVWKTGESEYLPARFYKDEHGNGTWRENWVYKLPGGEIVAAYNDITKHKQAGEALRFSEQKYRSIFDNAVEGIFQTTLQGKFLSANPAMARMLGYASPEELISSVTNIGEQLYANPEDRSALVNILKEKGAAEGFELHQRRKDGSLFWTFAKVRIVKGETGDILYFEGTYEDITSRKIAEEELKQTLDKLRKSLSGTIQAMSLTVETRDPYTAGHQRRVSKLARTIAQEMGLSNDTVDTIRMAGTIHDIGKISVPAEILSKPGKLSNIEFSLIKVHSQSGYDILKDAELPYPIAETVLQHHERLDGSGYPNGLKNGQIILEAKIISVADVVEAISSHRPYRPAIGIDAALEEIEKNKGVLYDEKVVDACVNLFLEKGFKFE